MTEKQEMILRRKAIEPAFIDKISAEEKYSIPMPGLGWYTNPMLTASPEFMTMKETVRNPRWREGYTADPDTCGHHNQSFRGGRWICRDCGIDR